MAVDINITPIIREVTIEIGQGGGAAVWGSISGTLADQTDLALEQTAQDTLISTNATDIGTNVTGILALDTDVTNLETSQGVQDTAIGLNTAKVTFPEAPNDGTQYARKDLGWEAVAGGSSPILTAYKSADESKVNSTAYGIDADLILTMEANALYEFTAMLIATSDSSSSIRARFNNPVDAVGEYTEKYSSEGETQLYGSKLNIIGNSLKTIGQLKGIVSSVTGGTFQFAWGQNSSGAIGSTIHKGSTISLKKLN